MKVGDLVMKRQPSKRKPIGIIVRAFGESNVLLVQWMAGGRLRTTARSLLLVSES
jgi:hypothetical protein